MLGCHRLLEPGDGPALIFDIGGGSTELVLIDTDDGEPQIKCWWSAPWGVVSLTESEGRDFADGRRAARRLRADARARPPRLPPLRRHCCPPTATDIRLMGTSGTVTTLASVHLALPSYDRRAVDGLHDAGRGDAEDQRACSPAWTMRSARNCPASATSAPTWSSPAARSSRRSWTSGRRRDPGRRRPRHPRRHPALADGARRPRDCERGSHLVGSPRRAAPVTVPMRDPLPDGSGGSGPGSRPPRAARSARPAGSSGSSTIPMSSAPRPRATARAPPTS